MEKILRQIFRLFVVTPLASKITIHRFPVSVEQEAYKGFVFISFRFDALDQSPLRRQKALSHTAYVCVIAMLHVEYP